jgi:hypothetical protein
LGSQYGKGINAKTPKNILKNATVSTKMTWSHFIVDSLSIKMTAELSLNFNNVSISSFHRFAFADKIMASMTSYRICFAFLEDYITAAQPKFF